MIELGKKYKLKKIKDFRNSDNTYFKVISFYNFDIAICENDYGERFVFMKEFFTYSDMPDEIYSDLILERKES